jgi:CelD/BcsL family acetyltransferase involved in cellulose biosynthesis
VSRRVVAVARTLEELEHLRATWRKLPWEREEAAYEYFTTRLETRPDVIGPLAAVCLVDGRPAGGLAGRLELRRLSTSVGYKVVYAPQVRLLRVVDGGIAGADDPAVLDSLLEPVRTALRDGTADAVELPPAELGSTLLEAFLSLGGTFERQPFVTPWTRRTLELPATFEEFVASRSSNTRWRIRRDARRLAETFGDELRVEIVRDPAGLDRLVLDADRVARSTYQRALGAGFSDTLEQRALAAVGLENGWVRGYLLYLRDEPIAYWLCSTYGGTILIRTAGFDTQYAELRVGLHLLMRVIDDAISDPDLHVLDFGPGDAAYKQQFSNESRQERNVVVFAPTLRGRRLNATRTLVLAPARGARRLLDETGLTDKVKTRWRRGAVRLRA